MNRKWRCPVSLVLAGFPAITAKAGNRNIDFIGTNNTIGGSLFIDADAVAQKIGLGAGADTFNLGDGTSLNYLFVSFGAGIDTFNDEFFGLYPFATAFRQLPKLKTNIQIRKSSLPVFCREAFLRSCWQTNPPLKYGLVVTIPQTVRACSTW